MEVFVLTGQSSATTDLAYENNTAIILIKLGFSGSVCLLFAMTPFDGRQSHS
jgi:hypothetical protein